MTADTLNEDGELRNQILSLKDSEDKYIISTLGVTDPSKLRALIDFITTHTASRVSAELQPFTEHRAGCRTLEAFYGQKGPYKDMVGCFHYLCDCGALEVIQRLELLAQLSPRKEEDVNANP